MQVQKQSVRILTARDLYHQKRINVQKLSNQLTQCAIIEYNLFKALIRQCKKITCNQPNVIELADPVTIVGDVHGQYYDLLKILSLSGLDKPVIDPNHKVVFMGDYVDRGLQSLQVITHLLCLKLEYPKNVILLRGNHESRTMTEQYNFREECINIYNQEIYDLFMEFFDTLPLACIVNKSYFCVHGGISDKQATISQINSIQRVCEIPLSSSLYCDLVWSDPVVDDLGRLKGKVAYNNSRDCSIFFGAALVEQFLRQNNLKTVIRAHEVFLEGYNLHKWSRKSNFPPLITVFSAPNYCGTYGNKGAILKISENQIKIKQLKEHQPEKHKCLTFDVFSWTMDEVMNNINDVMKYLTKAFAKKKFPEMKNLSQQNQGILFYKYAQQAKKVKPNLKVTETSITRIKMTEEEQRNFLFNRSLDYYGESEKAINRSRFR